MVAKLLEEDDDGSARVKDDLEDLEVLGLVKRWFGLLGSITWVLVLDLHMGTQSEFQWWLSLMKLTGNVGEPYQNLKTRAEYFRFRSQFDCFGEKDFVDFWVKVT